MKTPAEQLLDALEELKDAVLEVVPPEYRDPLAAAIGRSPASAESPRPRLTVIRPEP